MRLSYILTNLDFVGKDILLQFPFDGICNSIYINGFDRRIWFQEGEKRIVYLKVVLPSK